MSFVVIFALTCSLNGGDARGLATPIPGEPRCEGNISLRLFATQTVIAVGHSVPLRVEIQNCGQKALWIAIANEENLGFPVSNRRPRSLAVRSCRVTIQHTEGITHAGEVTAESLYEAVGQGLAALRGHDWVMGIKQEIVKFSVRNVRVEHEVKLKDFTTWLEGRDVLHARR